MTMKDFLAVTQNADSNDELEAPVKLTQALVRPDSVTLDFWVTIGTPTDLAYSIQFWSVSCATPLHFRISDSQKRDTSSPVEFLSDHPLIWEFADPERSLGFSVAPTEPQQAQRDLITAHVLTAGTDIPVNHYLRSSVELLAGGHGILARGPERLISAYLAVLERHGMDAYLIPGSESRDSSDRRDDIRLLRWNDSFIVGTGFTARPMEQSG